MDTLIVNPNLKETVLTWHDVTRSHHNQKLFVPVRHRSTINSQLNGGTNENMSVSCRGNIGAPALRLKAAIELDTAAVGGRERGEVGVQDTVIQTCTAGQNCPLTEALLMIYCT